MPKVQTKLTGGEGLAPGVVHEAKVTDVKTKPNGDVVVEAKVGAGTKRTPMTMSGFCSVAAEIDRVAAAGFAVEEGSAADQHRRCKGAVSNGAAKTWLCSCSCHDGHAICHECGFDHTPGIARDGGDYGEWDGTRRACANRTDCATRLKAAIEHARATDPLLIQIAEIQREAAAERQVENAERAKKRAEERARAEAAGPDPEAAKEAIRGRTKAPQRCHCGCGELTKGGQFCMGHDMKLKGRLFAAARGKGEMVNVLEATEVVARGWNEKGINDRTLQNARARVAELGAAEVIIAAVEGRYS